MVISFQGIESFKITQGDLSLAVNPRSKIGANIILINSSAFASESKEGSFVINGPGEYEVKDVVIKGFLSESEHGSFKRFNTIYIVTLDGVNLGFLGALSNPVLSSEALEALEEVDILFVPIGGDGVLDPTAAYKLAVSLEPSIIIPMHYGEVGDKKALEVFLKEGGEEKIDALDKLVIKKKDLEGREGEIVVLKQE